jgi:hypothetical protein
MTLLRSRSRSKRRLAHKLLRRTLVASGPSRPPGESLSRSQSGEQRTSAKTAKMSFLTHFNISSGSFAVLQHHTTNAGTSAGPARMLAPSFTWVRPIRRQQFTHNPNEPGAKPYFRESPVVNEALPPLANTRLSPLVTVAAPLVAIIALASLAVIVDRVATMAPAALTACRPV